jgi:hypothetical protein
MRVRSRAGHIRHVRRLRRVVARCLDLGGCGRCGSTLVAGLRASVGGASESAVGGYESTSGGCCAKNRYRRGVNRIPVPVEGRSDESVTPRGGQDVDKLD